MDPSVFPSYVKEYEHDSCSNENLDVYSWDEKVYIWNGILWEKQSTLKKEFLPTPLLDEK